MKAPDSRPVDMSQVDLEEILSKNAATASLSQSLCSVRDAASNRYYPPRAVDTLRVAIRDFSELCEKDPHISKHLQDYDLYHVGTFDPSTGKSSACDPIQIARGVNFRKVTAVN